MRESHLLNCHTRCTTYSRCVSYQRNHLIDNQTNHNEHIENSGDNVDSQCTQDDDDWHILAITESITHRFSAVRRSTESNTDHSKNVDTTHTHKQYILRINRARPQHHTRHNRFHPHWCPFSRWSLLTILNLVLLWCSQPTIGAIASQNLNPQFSPHRNHSNTINTSTLTDQLPSSTESIVSSLLSAPSTSSLLSLSTSTLLLEELLQEQSLEDAIHKLTSAWNQVHGQTNQHTKAQAVHNKGDLSSDQMISSQQVKLVNLYDLASEDTSLQTEKSPIERTRRSAKPEEANSNKSQKSRGSYFDEDMMTTDDSRAYEYGRVNRTKSNDLLSKERGKSSNSSKPLTAQTQPVTANCTRCRQKDEARSLRLESVKFSILSKLGLQSAPNVSLKSLPRIPPISNLLRQYGSSAMLGDDPGTYESGASSNQKRFSDDFFGVMHRDHDQETDDYYVNTQRTIVFAQAPPPERFVLSKLRAQYFKFPTNVVNSQIQGASLWLYLKGSNSRKADTSGYIVIYKVARGKETNLFYFQKKRIAKHLIRRGGWIQIELKSLVSEWFSKPEENLGLAIHSYDTEGKSLTIIHQDDVSFESNMRPYFEVQVSTQSAESIRRKRMTTLNCEEKSQEVRCCRYPLTIDFESFGWDWIIAPKRYEANYCSGECSLVFMNGYPHTHLMQQSQLYNPTGPCCSPRKMSPISMLYMDGDYNIIYGILPNMVVNKCDCS